MKSLVRQQQNPRHRNRTVREGRHKKCEPPAPTPGVRLFGWWLYVMMMTREYPTILRDLPAKMYRALVALPQMDPRVVLLDGTVIEDVAGFGQRLAEGEVLVDHIFDGLVFCLRHSPDDAARYLALSADALAMFHRERGVGPDESRSVFESAIKASLAGARAEVAAP